MNYISDASDFSFARKLTIKGLFNPKDIFARFAEIHFISFTAFSNFFRANLFTPLNQDYVINIDSRNELEALLTIITSTRIDEKVAITVHYEPELLDSIFDLVTDQKIAFSSGPEFVEAILGRSVATPVNATFWVEYLFTAGNYAVEYEKLIKLFLKAPQFQLINLQFDYESFESLPLSELHRLAFYMNLLKAWLTKASGKISNGEASNNMNCCNAQSNGRSNEGGCSACSDPEISYRLTLRNRLSPIRCYVDENLDIRLNQNEVFFPMSSYLEKAGEDLPVKVLNKIRKIVDIKFDNPGIINWYLVDLDQNFKVMGDHYRIPHITRLISEWLGY